MICEKCGQECDTVTCSACGRVIAKLGPFCYLCGGPLAAAEVPQAQAESNEEDDFSSRILCSDGTCIGVVNEQGICKVCGKPYTPEA